LVLDIARACIYRRPSRLPYLAGKLTGLGAGLTPSGDDFLGGLLFAVNHLHAVYPDAGFAEYAIPTDPYRSRTHLISFTLLQDHASGHAIAPLHHLLNGFISGASLESMRPYVSQLTQIGHSTGWDLLTGLLTALLAANDPQAGR
jgi:hypothetical protein